MTERTFDPMTVDLSTLTMDAIRALPNKALTIICARWAGYKWVLYWQGMGSGEWMKDGHKAPKFCDSLDAAVTLTVPHTWLKLSIGVNTTAWYEAATGEIWQATADLPPRAVCLAYCAMRCQEKSV